MSERTFSVTKSAIGSLKLSNAIVKTLIVGLKSMIAISKSTVVLPKTTGAHP